MDTVVSRSVDVMESVRVAVSGARLVTVLPGRVVVISTVETDSEVTVSVADAVVVTVFVTVAGDGTLVIFVLVKVSVTVVKAKWSSVIVLVSNCITGIVTVCVLVTVIVSCATVIT